MRHELARLQMGDNDLEDAFDGGRIGHDDDDQFGIRDSLEHHVTG